MFAGWNVGTGVWVVVMHADERTVDETRNCINFSGCLFFCLLLAFAAPPRVLKWSGEEQEGVGSVGIVGGSTSSSLSGIPCLVVWTSFFAPVV